MRTVLAALLIATAAPALAGEPSTKLYRQLRDDMQASTGEFVWTEARKRGSCETVNYVQYRLRQPDDGAYFPDAIIGPMIEWCMSQPKDIRRKYGWRG
jgi:hypothetical protein